MADEQTYREAIPMAIRDIVIGIDGVEYAEVDRSLAINIDAAPMASCFVYAGPETRVTADNEATLGFETWDMIVIVEIWAFKTDLEIILGRVHRALNDDRFLTVDYTPRGQLLCATGIKRTGADPQYFEADNEKKAMLVSFIARYRHEIGDMFVPA